MGAKKQVLQHFQGLFTWNDVNWVIAYFLKLEPLQDGMISSFIHKEGDFPVQV